MAVTTAGVARTAGALALAGAGALAYASLIEVRWYTLRQVVWLILAALVLTVVMSRSSPSKRPSHHRATVDSSTGLIGQSRIDCAALTKS